MSEMAWQPMRTAPKDGTAVLLLLDASDIPYAARWLKPDDRRGSGFEAWHIVWDGYRVKAQDRPRYWMPCPDDPDEAQAKDQVDEAR